MSDGSSADSHHGTRPRRPSRIAIVGCGAVTEQLHLPALAKSDTLRVTALIDVDLARARQLAADFGIAHVAADCAGLSAHADIAVIAVPHHLHARLAVAAMEAGLHAFVEKPLAPSMDDARIMLDAAERLRRRIGVGLIRRQYPSFKVVESALAAGVIGKVHSFDFREGSVYAWPLASDATFRRQTHGGVLLDLGAHTLDWLFEWFGDFRDVAYTDDSRGGVDANCLLRLTMANGITGTIEMSRTRYLRGTCIIRGDRGEMEIATVPRGPVTVRVDAGELTAIPRLLREPEEVRPDDNLSQLYQGARLQIEEFAGAIERGDDCRIFAEHTLGPIRLFDACRRQAQPLELPWESFDAPFDFDRLAGKSILVLGGTGFVGARLVGVLALKSTAHIRVLVRSFGRLASLSRFEVEPVLGDVTDRESLARALKDCDIVVNCTWGHGTLRESARVNVDAVRLLVEEAARAGCERVVHLSTIVALGLPPDGELTEEAPSRPARSNAYAFTKWKGDQAALETACRLDVDVRILMPTAIYGPYSPSWTVNPLRTLRNNLLPLVNGGEGVCNHIYVDDMVLAVLCAATADAGRGERFIASGPAPSPWREFYGAYERMLGITSTATMSIEELAAARKVVERGETNLAHLKGLLWEPAVQRRLRSLPLVRALKEMVPRRIVEAAKGTVQKYEPVRSRTSPTRKPVLLLAEYDALYQSKKTPASIAKAQRLLGYQPVFDLDAGMARTHAWARWANLIG